MKPQIRIDQIHNRAVIIAPSRNKRPHDFLTEALPPGPPSTACVFCPHNVKHSLSIDRIGSLRAWRMNVIRNIFPVVGPNFPQAYGRQEVVIETPHHNVELAEMPVQHIAELLLLYGRRTRAISRDKRIGYILIFKNNGGRAGASITHAHSQIFASEFVPPHIQAKLVRAQAYRISHGECYYCHLIRTERRGPRWIADAKSVVAFTPYASNYNYEAWILPKRGVDNIAKLTTDERLAMARLLKQLIVRLRSLHLPYNFYLHQNIKDRQEHLYLRVCPRRDVWAGIELGSRLIINTVAPETAARFYRRK